MFVCACMCACVRARVCVGHGDRIFPCMFVCARMCVCVRVRVWDMAIGSFPVCLSVRVCVCASAYVCVSF